MSRESEGLSRMFQDLLDAPVSSKTPECYPSPQEPPGEDI